MESVNLLQYLGPYLGPTEPLKNLPKFLLSDTESMSLFLVQDQDRWFKSIRPDHFNPVEGPPLSVCDFKQQLADILALE